MSAVILCKAKNPGSYNPNELRKTFLCCSEYHVIPAQAGIRRWTPAFAGVTHEGRILMHGGELKGHEVFTQDRPWLVRMTGKKVLPQPFTRAWERPWESTQTEDRSREESEKTCFLGRAKPGSY